MLFGGPKSRFLYFAYGSNMLTARLRRRTPSARAISKEYIAGRVLWTFNGPPKGSDDIRANCKPLLDGGPPMYSGAMKVAFELSPAQAEKLNQEAKRLGVSPDELARAAVADLLATKDEEFLAAAERVLRKNEDLYRRLA